MYIHVLILILLLLLLYCRIILGEVNLKVGWVHAGGPRVRVWTTSRFQKNETGSCHNERIRRFAAEYSFVVLN